MVLETDQTSYRAAQYVRMSTEHQQYGPFVGFEAIFKTADAESRSMILLDMLSKPVAMRIETASLRRAG